MPPRDNDSVESPLPQHLNYSKSKMYDQKKSRKSKGSSRPHSQSRYLEEYRQLAGRNPIYSSLFKNEEQITSSLAALNAASVHISSNTLCLVLGDGRTPRTAVAAAMKYGWNVVSIDEKLDDKWIQPRSPNTCRYICFQGSMSDFLSEGLDLVQSSLCSIAAIQELVVVCMEKDGGYGTLKSLKGRLGVSDLRVLYNNVSATLVSLSSEENEQECPLKTKPNEAFVDEDILADNRLVQVWKFQGSRKLSDASSNAVPSRSASNKRSNSKVAQLQRQQDLARNNRMQSQKKLSTPNDDDGSSSDEKKQRKSKPKRKSKFPVDPQRESAVTVSSFLSHQKSMQKEQESYRTNSADNAMLLTNGEGDYETNHSPISSRSPMIDTVPSDHPSSSIIQTHRTCTVCHRTLSRSQFSDRDRYLVHLSLGPGAVCRTCSMTVAATKLKMMPSHSQLLSDYAHRGEYLMKNGQLPALGYAPANDTQAAEGAIVLHDGNDASGVGNQLVPFQHEMNDSAGSPKNPFMAPPMGVDVNAPFSGILPEEERPTHIADCKYIDAVLSMPCYPKLNSMELFSSSKDVSVSMAALDAIKLYGTMDAEYFVAHDENGEKVVPRSMRKKIAASGKDSPTSINAKSIVCLVIGEGSQPRTAVLASLHYGWTTLSIDPTLDEDWDGYQEDVPNYSGYSGTISEFMSDEYTESYFELDNSQSKVAHLVIIGVQMTKDELRLKGQSNINEIRARYNDIPTTLVSMSPLRKATLAPKRRNGQCGSKLEKDVGYEPNCSYIDEGVFSVCRLVEVWNFHNEDEGVDEEGSIEDDDYSKESIGDRNDRYRDRDYEKRFSQERIERCLSSEEAQEEEDDANNCSTYERFQKHVKRAEKDRKCYDEQKRLISRKGTSDSLMSGSTLSTKETMKKQSTQTTAYSEALVPAIASRLEQENSRRKSKAKKSKSRRRKSSDQIGRRPIPDDIPEDLEINSSFLGFGPESDQQELVEWNEQTYDGNYDHAAGDDAIIERVDSYTDSKGGYKRFDYPVETHNLSDTWNGVAADYDAHDDRSYGSYREKGSEDNMRQRNEDDNIEQNHDDKSYQSESSHASMADRNGAAKQDDHGSYSSQSDEDYCAKEKRNSDSTDDRYGNNHGDEKHLDHSEHSSDEFDALRNQAEYYGLDDDQSCDTNDEDLPSTNSGIEALNELNESSKKLDANEDEDDAFPEYWSEEEDVKPPPASSTTTKRKPWHRKETQEHSFMSSYDSYE